MPKIIMLLARGPGLPEGDLNDRLTVQAKLTAQGQLDSDAVIADSQPWVACRERPGQNPKKSELVWLEKSWFLRSLDGDDDPLWALNATVLRPGEPVILHRPDHQELIFRIVALETD